MVKKQKIKKRKLIGELFNDAKIPAAKTAGALIIAPYAIPFTLRNLIENLETNCDEENLPKPGEVIGIYLGAFTGALTGLYEFNHFNREKLFEAIAITTLISAGYELSRIGFKLGSYAYNKAREKISERYSKEPALESVVD